MTATAPEGPRLPHHLPHHLRLRLALAATLPVLTPATLAAAAGLLPWTVLPAVTAAEALQAYRHYHRLAR
ncbi:MULTISPECIES: hypothetical protein [unclassified Kitasatospora]|uniref:hypothetical protein n=1 Tax=unclassified Kitasatospora TaxID=2633591 RepID=UPI0033F5A035